MQELLRSPFGGPVRHIRSLNVETLRSMYLEKCNYDPKRHFCGLEEISLYECETSGMRFWTPSTVAGDEEFYATVSQLWPNYYKTNRWEYEGARGAILSEPGKVRVLEIGCGKGYFLKSIENIAESAAGLELNRKAIEGKVTNFPVFPVLLQDHLRGMAGRYDCVCSFQVLEHVDDPKEFLLGASRLLRSGGKLIISTPNYDFPLNASAGDAFDLPPHHLNHFTPDVFGRIAQALGFKLVSTTSEKIFEPRFRVWVGESHTKAERFIRSKLNSAVGLVASKVSPGHTVLAIFQVP